MSPHALMLLKYLPLAALLFWAAVGDCRSRRIPNWLTLPLAVAGILQSFCSVHTATPGQALLGFAAGFALTIVLFALGALGGGDVKLLAAVGAWIGPQRVFAVFLVAAVIGMLMVLAQAARQGRLRVLFRNSAAVAINLVHVRDLGVEHARRTGQSCRSVDEPLPYAVPVLAAVLLLLLIAASFAI
jgi:prepilin peptidase CpaA